MLKKTVKASLDSKGIKPFTPKGNQSWIFTGRTNPEAETPATLATWWEEPTHWKRPWCWERWRAGGKGGIRGWDGWMASLAQWTWVWANSRRQWRTGKLGVLLSMVSQRSGRDLVIEEQQQERCSRSRTGANNHHNWESTGGERRTDALSGKQMCYTLPWLYVIILLRDFRS